MLTGTTVVVVVVEGVGALQFSEGRSLRLPTLPLLAGMGAEAAVLRCYSAAVKQLLFKSFVL